MLPVGRALAHGCALASHEALRAAALVALAHGSSASRNLPAKLISCARLLSEQSQYNNSALRVQYSTATHQRQPETVSAEDEAVIALCFSGTPPTTDILGPTKLVEIPGKGRGLVASLPLGVGDLVMAVGPLGVLHGPQDAMPPPDALVEHLRSNWGRMSREQRTAIADLHGARPGAAAAATTSAAAGDASTAATDGVDVRSVVSYNAYGDEYEDLPAADLRSSASSSAASSAPSSSPSLSSPPAGGPRSLVGLWPHFARLNHSCAPNCVHYVVGSTMVVRAVQPIPEGTELQISYLGRDDLAPRQVRQAILQSRYGFRCECPRCRTESELPEELQTLLQQLHDRSRHELAPRFERLAAAAANAAAADGAGLTSMPPADEEEEEDEGETAGEGVEGGVAGAAGAAGVKAAPSGMTAAEAAKRALRKAGGPPQWPTSQLAALEPRLEECARQLHLAIKEVQEDDEAVEGEGSAAPAAASAPPASSPGVRHLSRVQTAQAASYQLMELLHLHAELSAASWGAAGASGSGGRSAATAAAALGACWHVLDAISRGSELQVFQACKLLSDALQQSRYSVAGARPPAPGAKSPAPPPPEAVREAAALLGQSLVARYGRLRGQQLSRMTQAAMRSSRDFF